MQLDPVIESFGQEDQSWLASAHGTSSARPVTLDVTKFDPSTHYPNGYLPSGILLAELTATGLFAPYDPTTDEQQTVTITGAPTGGTFTLTFAGHTTAAIAFNATASAVHDALVALASVGAGNVLVTGSAGGPYTVTFVGALASEDVAAMTATPSLTGGTSPGVTIATIQAGGAAGASDGQQTLIGFLFTSTQVLNRNGTTPAVVQGALLDHCKVRTAKLPFPVDAAGMAQVKGSVLFI